LLIFHELSDRHRVCFGLSVRHTCGLFDSNPEMKMRNLMSAVTLSLLAGSAFASELPEPGSLGLLGLGIAAVVAVALLKKK
jgi:PEP-CTERM motif